MSGVCGICAPGAKIDSAVVASMTSALSLPGEKSYELVSSGAVILGVAPRWDSQQVASIPGLCVAIDADLYNINELKSKLAARGLASNDWSLSLCIAHLYLIYGPDFVEHLHGAFSVAVWDEKEQRFLLAIDRLGIKSLYWSQENGALLFGSRLASIRATRNESFELDPHAISQYLLFAVIPHPLTIYKQVHKLAPGTRLIFENGLIRQDTYWDLDYSESGNRDVSYWAREVQEAMRASVLLHLDGCSPDKTGAYLSGGTDSSSVVAFMNERHAPVNTFSIYFREAEYSEAHFAQTTAGHFRTHHREKEVRAEDAFRAIQDIIRYYDEPLANSSAFGAYYCAALAREAGVDTLLAGDGGDELFAGNSRYADDKKFALYHRLPRWLRDSIVEPVSRLLPLDDGLFSLPRKYIRRATIPNPDRILSYNFLAGAKAKEIFESGFLDDASLGDLLRIANGHFHRAKATSELNRLLYLDLKITIADNDIRKVNGTAELNGVRVRYPLLDFKLAEVSGRVPSDLKLSGFEKRFIFKKAMRQILPHEVLYKKKHGFGVPLGRWLLENRQFNELLQDVFHDPRTRQRGYFRPAFYDEILHLHQGQHVGFYGEVIWYLLALELWHREHFDVPVGAYVR